MSQFSGTRLTIAGIIAVLPVTPVGTLSVFGVHDFIIKRYWQGIVHILIASASGILFSGLFFQNSNNSAFSLILEVLPWIPLLVSYIWALIEGVQILQYAKQPKQEPVANNTEMSSTVPADQSQTTPEGTQKQLDTAQGNELKNQKKYGHRAIISLVATLIPIFLFIICLIISGGSADENGPGFVWWFMIMYYWSLGLPLFAVAIAFGILGLKTDLRPVAIISLSLKALTLIFIILLFSGVFSR